MEIPIEVYSLDFDR
jgi:hypothetical protein